MGDEDDVDFSHTNTEVNVLDSNRLNAHWWTLLRLFQGFTRRVSLRLSSHRLQWDKCWQKPPIRAPFFESPRCCVHLFVIYLLFIQIKSNCLYMSADNTELINVVRSTIKKLERSTLVCYHISLINILHLFDECCW